MIVGGSVGLVWDRDAPEQFSLRRQLRPSCSSRQDVLDTCRGQRWTVSANMVDKDSQFLGYVTGREPQGSKRPVTQVIVKSRQSG